MDLREALEAQTLDLIQLKTKLPGQDEPAYYKPMTLADHDKVKAILDLEGAAITDSLALAVNICQKVVDADGRKIFDLARDRRLLMEGVRQDILVDIVNEIAAPISLEEAEGN